jgi:thiol-disulfide isomerase/thioredoxin
MTISNAPKIRNLILAIVAIVLSGLVAIGLRSTSPNALDAMAKTTVPYEQALANGKPSLVEFYANWCGACKSMVPTLQSLKKQYGDRVNFVMLNVDNDKWLPEVTRYKVDGIPHFLYLNSKAELAGSAIGEQPQSIVDDNLQALINKTNLPHAQVLPGQTSDYQPPTASKPTNDDPRSHGSQVKASEA